MYHSKYIDEKSVTSDEMQRCLKEGIAGIKGEDALMLIDAVIDEDLEGEKAPLTKENIKKWFDNAETNVFSTYNGSPFSEDEINDFLDETGIGYENDNVDYAEVDWDKVMDYLGRTEDASISFHYYNYGAVFMDMRSFSIRRHNRLHRRMQDARDVQGTSCKKERDGKQRKRITDASREHLGVFFLS